jgi:hypothetical protein
MNNDHITKSFLIMMLSKRERYFAIKEIMIGWSVSSFMMKYQLWRLFSAQ